MEFQIKYKHLMISIIIIFSIIFIIDRFTYNIWPLYFTKSTPIEDDWTATTFFIIGWVFGRELIISSSFIWLLQCRCLWNWVFEHKPNWLIVDDIMIENNHMHYHLGWAAIALPMLIHTWLVFLPLLQDHNHFIFHNQWWRPIDPLSEPKFFVETYHHHEVNVSWNDLYALIVITIIFVGMFPIGFNKKFRAKHWSMATYLHQTAAFLYAVELLRTPLTAHCWFISTPFILLYIIDRALATFYYRFTDKAKVICQYNFDDKYMLICLDVPDIYYHLSKNDKGVERMIGDVFWLNTEGFAYRKIPQPAHPFTSFFNHNNAIPDMMHFIQSASVRKDINHPSHKFQFALHKHRDVAVNKIERQKSYVIVKQPTLAKQATIELIRNDQLSNSFETSTKISTELKEININSDGDHNSNDSDDETPEIDKLQTTRSVFIDSVEQEWNVGFLIRIHERNDKYGFTQRVAQRKAIKEEDSDNYMMSYGPYRSSFANIVDYVNHNDDGAIVLIATGAGASYIIDTLLYFLGKLKSDPHYKLRHKLRIHFSCRSIPLFQWVTDFLWEECSQIENVQLYAYLTSHKTVHQDECDDDDRTANFGKVGRCSFEKVLKESPPRSKVFFCGHPRIQSDIKKICKNLHFTFYEGHSFG